jgi:two-component system response regulator FlrC
MININEENIDFAHEVQKLLQARGVDCCTLGISNDFVGKGENIFVSCTEKDFIFSQDKKLVPFLKANKFQKAVLFSWESEEFKVESYLNGAINIFRIPIAFSEQTLARQFYFQYVLESVVQKLPNLPCSDDNSVKLNSLIKKIAPTDATVLVNGPTGTGKEVVSNLIHHFSNRRDKAFVAVNCAAIPDQMLESMLFGHEKGAFTGAVQPNKGLLRAADTGTVLLDEISEMPIGLQAKLLRVIQEKKVMPIGSSEEIEVNVRIIATTNRNMLEEVKSGRFREDLYYRLNVFPLNTLNLSKRSSDIPTIVANMMYKLDSGNEVKIKFSENAFERLKKYHWPGNVRELHNVIQRATILCSNGEILASDLIFDSGEDDPGVNTADALAAKFQNSIPDEVVL